MKVKLGMKNAKMSDIAALCGREPLGRDRDVEFFCTDSREADQNTLFVVSIGERVDGHDYMLSAAKNGCRCFLCQRIPNELEESGLEYSAIIADDTIKALARIAEGYVKSVGIKTVAITGSVGKTTTKEFVAAVLAQSFKLHKTKANHNSTVGMPMSMLEIFDEELSVAEMGMSGFGEIEIMSRVAKPSVACITNIGSSHLELLGSRENICHAKLEVIDGMDENGTVILNGDEPLLTQADCKGLKKVFVGINSRSCQIRAERLRYGDDGSVFDIIYKDKIYKDVQITAIGKQFVYASLFAFAVGIELGAEDKAILEGLKNFKNADMRQNIYSLGGITIIEDCYNASPESMRAAIDVLRTLKTAKGGAHAAALLGDMRELGVNSASFHLDVGSYFAQNGGDLLVTLGPLANGIAMGALECGMSTSKVHTVDDCDKAKEAADILAEKLEEGDILLVKASRAVGAERVIKYLKEEHLKED